MLNSGTDHCDAYRRQVIVIKPRNNIYGKLVQAVRRSNEQIACQIDRGLYTTAERDSNVMSKVEML